MGQTLEIIDSKLRAWLERAPLYFVATAPLAPDGHINCSPKGRDSLRVLGPLEIAYLDLPGSGVETIAHLRENGRIVLMVCAFEGPPRICRLHGRGTVIAPNHGEFASLVTRFPPQPAVRSVVRIAVERIAESCGYGVPLMEVRALRTETEQFVSKSSTDGLRRYVREKNATSIDQLPGVTAAEADSVLVDQALARAALAAKFDN